MKVLRESDYITVPWKNGGGETREILRESGTSGDFDWRLSLATIGSSGPFSAFAGYDRILTLVGGAGVELTFGSHGSSKLAEAGQMVQFDGAWPTGCTLLDGPSTDLNLIVSQARAESVSRCIRIADAEQIVTNGWSQTLLCCICGAVRITSAAGESEDLASVDTAVCVPSDGTITCRSRSSSPARVFVAGVLRRQPAVSRPTVGR